MDARFHVPEGTYLLSHSVGCLPHGSAEAVEAGYYRPWREAGGDAWPGWLEALTSFRAAVAGLIGARIDQVCPQTNVSGAVAKILHALPERPGRDTILLCEEDFPSIGFVAAAAAARGYRTRFLPRGEAAEDSAAWAAAVAQGDVQLAIVTHAFSNRSARLPVAEISAMLRRREVFSIVDAVQTLGVVPVDVTAWSADFVVGSSVKFLCGGPGAAFLWASDAVLPQTRPIDVGWFSHADPFAFDIHDFRAAADALRFWGGTPSVLPLVQAAHSIATLSRIGTEAIHAHNQALIQHLHDAMPDRIRSARDPARRGNAVLVATDDPADMLALLRSRRIMADTREGCIRLSPHIYNDLDDMDRLLAVLRTGTSQLC
jgi:kynureninase